jgi:heptosyltransferase II
MHASPESVLNSSGRILVCGVNWIGDSVMSMPALLAFRKANPTAHITMLVKPGLVPLWKLGAVFDGILQLHEGFAGTLKTVAAVRRLWFDKAIILPHSFRSAVIPWLAGIPARVGMPGHWRDFMLTEVVRPLERPGRTHQAYEYLDLLTPAAADAELEPPRLDLPEEALASARKRIAPAAEPRVALIPGAARGPAKQWPPAHFIELGRMLSEGRKCGIVVLGISREAALCEEVAKGIGPSALNLAGHTGLADWIATLKACDLVVANDSGGMHLAAAVGTPVVALYGITDPSKTGPLGKICRVLQNSDLRTRDIPRDSPEARASLAAIHPEQAFNAAVECLEEAKRK